MPDQTEAGALAIIEGPHIALPESRAVELTLAAVDDFKAAVHRRLTEGMDYGTIPGTPKPTLYQPGAQKICELMKLRPRFDAVPGRTIEDWERPLFAYTYRCVLVHIPSGYEVAECIASCNSMEGRYRWRTVGKRCPSCQGETIRKSNPQYGDGWYCNRRAGGCGASFGGDDGRITRQPAGRVENDDIYSQVNTLDKMAQKRGLVGAALFVGRLSDVFTQDMEDMPSTHYADDGPPPQQQQQQRTAQQRPAPARPAPQQSAQDGARKTALAHLQGRMVEQEGVDWGDFLAFLGVERWDDWTAGYDTPREAAIAAWERYDADKAIRAGGCVDCGRPALLLGSLLCAECGAPDDDDGDDDQPPPDDGGEQIPL